MSAGTTRQPIKSLRPLAVAALLLLGGIIASVSGYAQDQVAATSLPQEVAADFDLVLADIAAQEEDLAALQVRVESSEGLTAEVLEHQVGDLPIRSTRRFEDFLRKSDRSRQRGRFIRSRPLDIGDQIDAELELCPASERAGMDHIHFGRRFEIAARLLKCGLRTPDQVGELSGRCPGSPAGDARVHDFDVLTARGVGDLTGGLGQDGAVDQDDAA